MSEMKVVATIHPAGFRDVKQGDEELLFQWRHEQERTGENQGWYQGRKTTREAHHRWFRGRAGVLIWIWERDEKPLGYVRVDSNGELSFYPHTMDAVPMLAATSGLAERYGGRLKATVDAGNVAASEALEAAGFRESPVRFYAYRP